MNDKVIKELHIKYVGDGRNIWEVPADIINELIQRKDYLDDSSYYCHIHRTAVAWQLIQEYVDSTYPENMVEVNG